MIGMVIGNFTAKNYLNLMKSSFVFLASMLFLSFSIAAQDFAAFQDYRQRFFVFNAGEITQVETLEVEAFFVTKFGVAYLNNQEDVMLYNDKGRTKVDYSAETIKAKDNLVAYSAGSVLKAIVGEDYTKLTLNKGNYWMGDDIILYENAFQGTLRVYEDGKESGLAGGIFDSKTSSITVGENIAVYRFSNSLYKLYWNHKTYDVITYNGNITFSCGRDMVAFNDPITNTFVVFYQGQMYDVETQPAKSFKVGDNLLAYVDASGNFKVFDPSQNELPQTVANYGTTEYQVKDNTVAFFENGWLKYYSEGTLKQIVNYRPEAWAIDEANLVYIDLNGMLKGVMDGKEVEITTEKIKGFNLYNDCVVVNWMNETSSVYWKGKMYESF